MSSVHVLSRTTNDILLLERKKKNLEMHFRRQLVVKNAETAAVAISAKWLVNKLEHCGSLGYDKSSSVFTTEIYRKTRKLVE